MIVLFLTENFRQQVCYAVGTQSTAVLQVPVVPVALTPNWWALSNPGTSCNARTWAGSRRLDEAGFYQQPGKNLQEDILVTVGLRGPCPRSRANIGFKNSAIAASITWAHF